MADRWVANPHVFPNCCHRCLKSGEENGPYFHEEWDYCQPDRWPGADPAYPRVARKFTCRACFLYAAAQPGAPLTETSAKQLQSAQARINELEVELAEERSMPHYVNAKELLELVRAEAKPAARKAPANKKEPSGS